MTYPPVQSRQGLVTGVTSDVSPEVTIFKGLRFGADTSGENRWRAPQPPPSWEGVHVADTYGEASPQINYGAPTGIAFTAPDLQGEDCLRLNVFVPTKTLVDKSKPLPVLLWIHGGRYTFGAGNYPSYEGSDLASRGIIVVSINYRMGILGFLSHPELSAESKGQGSGNYGILDQIAALKWTNENIAAFGGDPSKIGVVGESAGAGSAGIIACSPLASGLVKRIITQSAIRAHRDPHIGKGPCSLRKLHEAEAQGTNHIEGFGFASIEEARKAPYETLITVNNDSDIAHTPSNSRGWPPVFRPVIDGYSIPSDYATIFAKGVNKVDFMGGYNCGEVELPGFGGVDGRTSLPVEEFKQYAIRTYGLFAPRFYELFPLNEDGSNAFDVWCRAGRAYNRMSFAIYAEDFRASYPDSKMYNFTFSKVPGHRGFSRGTKHGGELPYLFRTFNFPDPFFGESSKWHNAEDHLAADFIQRYWINFLDTGNPNNGPCAGEDLPAYPEQRVDGPGMLISDEPHQEPPLDPEVRQFYREYINCHASW